MTRQVPPCISSHFVSPDAALAIALASRTHIRTQLWSRKAIDINYVVDIERRKSFCVERPLSSTSPTIKGALALALRQYTPFRFASGCEPVGVAGGPGEHEGGAAGQGDPVWLVG